MSGKQKSVAKYVARILADNSLRWTPITFGSFVKVRLVSGGYAEFNFFADEESRGTVIDYIEDFADMRGIVDFDDSNYCPLQFMSKLEIKRLNNQLDGAVEHWPIKPMDYVSHVLFKLRAL